MATAITKHGLKLMADAAYEAWSHRAGKVNAADAPARNRPVIVKTNNSTYINREDVKLESIYVGDIVTWSSEAGEAHTGIAVGDIAEYLKVLYDNNIYFVDLRMILFLNGIWFRT